MDHSGKQYYETYIFDVSQLHLTKGCNVILRTLCDSAIHDTGVR